MLNAVPKIAKSDHMHLLMFPLPSPIPTLAILLLESSFLFNNKVSNRFDNKDILLKACLNVHTKFIQIKLNDFRYGANKKKKKKLQ